MENKKEVLKSLFIAILTWICIYIFSAHVLFPWRYIKVEQEQLLNNPFLNPIENLNQKTPDAILTLCENHLKFLNNKLIQQHNQWLSEEERLIIEYVVSGEAGYEPFKGKMLVAQCFYNAMKKENISAAEIRKQYQYSGWKTDLAQTYPEHWDEVVEAVSRVFDSGEMVSDKPILYFYAPKWTTSKWHESLPKDQVFGGHSFHYLQRDLTAEWFLNLQK